MVSSGQGARDDDLANSEFNLIDGDLSTSFRAKTSAQKEFIQVGRCCRGQCVEDSHLVLLILPTD